MPSAVPLPLASRIPSPARRLGAMRSPGMLRMGLLSVGVLLAALLAPRVASAQAARYALDPVHTRVVFELSHAGYSQAIGTVSGSTGTLVFDPADWSSARVSVSVPIARLDLGDAGWSRAALGRGLLDGGRYPVATFVSTRVEPLDAAHARVVGMLTLRGVAREIVLDVKFNQLKRYPLPPFRRTAGFSATTTLSRAAFGADAWSSLIGDTVALRIEAEAHRTGDVPDVPGAPGVRGADDVPHVPDVRDVPEPSPLPQDKR
jgi:polyisoprenoid-binding protein YceI